MKKRVLSIVSVMVATSMMAASLTGCGTRTKATDITVNDEDTIIVEEEDTETDTEAEAAEDEITETEVIGDDSDEDEETDTISTESGDIVFYDEIGKYPDYLLSEVEYETMEDKRVTAVDDIPVYSWEGIKVGYVKSGATVVLTEHGINTRWYRFENPISGTDYDYLCMLDDDIPIDENDLLTSDEVKEWIVERISKRDYDAPVFLDVPDSDMEYVEFSIDRQKEYPDAALIIDQAVSYGSGVGEFAPTNYITFCVECTENSMNIDCRLYYKELVEFE